MARKLRIYVEDTPWHVLLKSLNGMKLFQDETDYISFVGILKELNTKLDIDIHAYILMPTYFEFLATPCGVDTISRFMQSLGRNYVVYFNKKYSRMGTIWEGRYRSSLVEDEKYLFVIMKYIESLDKKDFKYSSIGKNLFNKSDSIISYHNLYKKLGFTPELRILEYSKIFDCNFDQVERDFIVNCLNKQLITGSDDFIKKLENLTNMVFTSKKRGRPKKIDKEKRKKMYKNLVVLDKEKHKDLKISPLEDLEFAVGSAFIPVVAGEVGVVGLDFPVVFASGKSPTLVSIVSLGGNSLAINSDKKWIAKYPPMYLRKYPYSLALVAKNSNQKVIMIDEDSKLFSKSKGKKLFKKGGEHSETLSHAVQFLQDYDKQESITRNIAKLISDSGILEDREIAIGEDDEKKVLVNGFKVVDKEKLNALSDDILADWVRKGIISMIDAHLASLEKIQNLFKLAQQRQN